MSTTKTVVAFENLRCILRVDAPVPELLEASLCPIRFRAQIIQDDSTYTLMIGGQTDVPDGSVLELTCEFSGLVEMTDMQGVKHATTRVHDGEFVMFLGTYAAYPLPGCYRIGVHYHPPGCSNREPDEGIDLYADLDVPAPTRSRMLRPRLAKPLAATLPGRPGDALPIRASA